MAHGARFYYWRTEAGNEVDLIWQQGKRTLGFEIKVSSRWQDKYNKGLKALLEAGAIQQAYGIYTGEHTLKSGDVTVLPYQQALTMAKDGFSLPEPEPISTPASK